MSCLLCSLGREWSTEVCGGRMLHYWKFSFHSFLCFISEKKNEKSDFCLPFKLDLLINALLINMYIIRQSPSWIPRCVLREDSGIPESCSAPRVLRLFEKHRKFMWRDSHLFFPFSGLCFVLALNISAGASRRPKLLATCPRCRFFTWKMCLSSAGYVAYERTKDWKAERERRGKV